MWVGPLVTACPQSSQPAVGVLHSFDLSDCNGPIPTPEDRRKKKRITFRMKLLNLDIAFTVLSFLLQCTIFQTGEIFFILV